MSDLLSAQLGELRWEPTAKRVRAEKDGRTLFDTTRAALVWEPKRIVAEYAVPVEDLAVPVEPDAAATPQTSDRRVYDPGVPFRVHTAAGEPVLLGGVEGFRLAGLDGYVEVAFRGADAWFEEDEPIVGHPRDPFHRLDCRRGSRQVRLELDGTLLAESSRPVLLFETGLPARFYLPREDVRVELRDSDTHSTCAYKGTASYLSPVVDGTVRDDLVWYYPDPLVDAEPIRDLVCFFDERVDVILDGELRERPLTPWSA